MTDFPKIPRSFGWLAVAAFALIGLYGLMPWGLAHTLEFILTKNGFSDVSISIGYPGLNQTTIQHVSLHQKGDDISWNLHLENVLITYQPLALLSGTIEQLVIPRASLSVSRNERRNRQLTPPEKFPVPSVSSPWQRLTIKDITKPLPLLPLSKLTIQHLSIKQPQAPPQFQHLELSGTWHYHNRAINSTVTVQGPHIPPYNLTITGAGTADMTMSLHQTGFEDRPIMQLISRLTPAGTNLNLEGSFQANLQPLSALISLFIPTHETWSQATGTLEAHWQGTIPPELSLATVTPAHLPTVHGSWRTILNLPRIFAVGSNLRMNMHGQFSVQDNQITWTLSEDSRLAGHLNLQAFRLPIQAQEIFPEPHLRLLIDFPESITGHFSFTDSVAQEIPHITVDGPIRARYGTNTSPLAIKLLLSQLSGNLTGTMRGKGLMTLSALWRGPAQSWLPVQKARGDISAEVTIKENALRAKVLSDSLLKIGGFQHNQLTIPLAKLTFKKPPTVILNKQGKSWNINDASIDILAPIVQWNKQIVSLKHTTFTLNQLKGLSSHWQATGNVAVNGVNTSLQGLTPPLTNWEIAFSGTPSTVQMAVHGVTQDKHVAINGHLTHDLLQQTGGLQLVIPPINFSPATISVRQLIDPWPYPMDVTTGTITGTARLAWGRQNDSPTLTQADLRLSFHDIGGYVQKILFTGLTTDVHLTGLNPWKTPEMATLTIQEVKSGITVSDITMNIGMEGTLASPIPRIDIRDVASSLLGGQATSTHILLDRSFIPHPFTISVKHLEINKILALEQQEGLQGTGLLDGAIPIVLTPQGVEVKGGILDARPPGGLIKFQPSQGTSTALASADSNLNMVLDALSNFHYSRLSIGVNYQPDGTLKLSMRLQGNNPDFLKGKSIDFHLTVEENIPTLLKTLRLAQGIEEQINNLLTQ